MNKSIAVLFFILTLGWMELAASPSYRLRRMMKQPDGTTLTVVRQGDEHASVMTTLDGYPVKLVNGAYYYALVVSPGNYAATSVLAHNAADRCDGELLSAYGDTDIVAAMSSPTEIFGRAVMGSQAGASVKAMGTQRIVVLMVQFADVRFSQKGVNNREFTNDAAYYQRFFNETGFSDDEAWGSVHDYFFDQSDGQFDPVFDVFGPVTLSHNQAYYGKNVNGKDGRWSEMVAEALDLLVKSGADLSPYADGMNAVNLVAMVLAGEGENFTGDENTLWSQYVSNFGYSNKYLFESVLYVNEVGYFEDEGYFRDGIGTFCHEFSHAMGLPDMYCTNGLLNVFGMDYWDLMDLGQYITLGKRPSGYSAYEREFMGWLTIESLPKTKQLVTLAPLPENDGRPRAYRIENEQDATGCEYYILENRKVSRWFSDFFGEGMLVYHIDYNASAWKNNTVNNVRSHQRMTPIPADGVLTPADQIESEEPYQGDLFPGLTGNTRLADDSDPPATAYNGGLMHILLSQITRHDNGDVTFCYMAEGMLPAPTGLKQCESGESAVAMEWNAVEGATSYRVSLFADNKWVPLDTVEALTYRFKQLLPGRDYRVRVQALADAYIDSEPQECVLSTLPDGIDAVGGELAIQPLSTIDGRPVKGAWETLPPGVYVVKCRDGIKKVRKQ